MLHILVGENASRALIERQVAARRRVNWIVPKSAQVGEKAVLFIPDHGFVGLATVATQPVPDVFGRRRVYASELDDIRLLSRPVALADAAAVFPDWKWPRYPRSYTSVTSPIDEGLHAFLEKQQKALGAAAAEKLTQTAQEPTAIEGIARETRTLARGRSAKLRTEALAQARGICAVCQRDFSTLLNGLGVRVLQVHHKEQQQTLSIEELRSRLESERV